MSASVAVHVQPRASRSAVVGMHADAIKIRLAAPPVDGAANAELVRFVAQRLRVPARDVAIVRGASGRRKAIRVAGMSADDVRRTLLSDR